VKPGGEPLVTVVGGATIDIHGKSAAPLREHDSNPGTVSISPGGVARNVAENLARLGVDCHLISTVGNDQHGEMLLALGHEAGIDMRCVQQSDVTPTSTYLSVLDDTGDMKLAISDMQIMDELNAGRIKQHRELLERSSLIVLDTNLPDDALAWLTSTYSDQTIFADTVSAAKATRLRPYLNRIHTLKTGTIEAEALTGLEAHTDAQIQKLAEWIHSHGVARLFITRGEHGVFYSTDDVRAVKTPHDNLREISNSSGAGDAFLAGLAYAWLQGWSLDRSVQFAMAAAQVTLSDRATSSPALSLDAIHQVLESQRD